MTHIQRGMIWAVLCVLAAAGSIVDEAWAAHNFSRYQTILDRMPFGDEPPPEIPPAPPPPPFDPNKSFAKHLRLSAMTEEVDGTIKVGIVDNQTKGGFWLRVGDIEEGVELVSADYPERKATLRKGSEMAVLAQGQAGEIEAIAPGQQKERLKKRTSRRPSYAERRRARMAARRNKPPPEPKYKGEELTKHLQDYQMEVIRQGLPPLPIPLTQEMDDQLVSEGVLPPSDEAAAEAVDE